MAELDNLQNGWGTILVTPPTSKSGRGVFGSLEFMVRSTIPGFTWEVSTPSGSSANTYAIMLATSCRMVLALIAQGSYVGGEYPANALSSSSLALGNQIAFPSHPQPSSCGGLSAEKQTVALPFFVLGHLACSEGEILIYETACLTMIWKKLLLGVFLGQPFQVILLELMLGGCGARLSDRFLIKLAELLAFFGCHVIVDEILTFGRVGPHMAMTSSTPQVFQDRVKYITVGKWLGCGMVFKRVGTRPNNDDSSVVSRFTSTKIDQSLPLLYYKTVCEKFKQNVLSRRREYVLKALSLDGNSVNVWGDGALLFSSKARRYFTSGLQCRVLMQLEDGKKIQRGDTIDTEWNRTSVTKELMNNGRSWSRKSWESTLVEHPFFCCLIDYVLETDPDTLKAGFSDQDILNHIGPREAVLMADLQRAGDRERENAPTASKMGPFKYIEKKTGDSSKQFSIFKQKHLWSKKRTGNSRSTRSCILKSKIGLDFLKEVGTIPNKQHE